LKGGILRPPLVIFRWTPAAPSIIERTDDPITHPFRKVREKDGVPGSSVAGRIPLWFAGQEMNMLRHDDVPIDVKPETAPRVPHPKIALFAILGWDVPP